MLAIKGSDRTVPWPHIYFHQVFEQEFYAELLDNLPPLQQCQPLTGYEDRLFWPIEGGIWEDVRKAICFEQLTKALCERLGVTRPAYPKAAICRDLPGYQIKPHVDASFKVMTLMIYLPQGMDQKFLGTMLWEPRFERAKQVGFFPNVGLAFKTDADTWHSAGPMDSVRDTLHVCYFDTPDREWR